jgi:hypothetical protein
MLDDIRPSNLATPLDRFQKLTDVALDQILQNHKSQPFETVRSAFEEKIRRVDAKFTDNDHEIALPKMALLQEAMRRGLTVKADANGKHVLDDRTPLSADMRFAYHRAIIGTTDLMYHPVIWRQEYVTFLRANRKFADAITVAEQASKKANILMKPVQVADKPVRMMDMLLLEQERLISDQALIADPVQRQYMMQKQIALRGATSDQGIINSPVNADKYLAMLHLGTEIIFKFDQKGNPIQIEKPIFGANTGFKPNLAMQAAIRARDTLAYISKNDPSTPAFGESQPAVASLFGREYAAIPEGTKFNMFLDKDKNGKPDLFEETSLENFNNKLREGHRSTSMMLDISTTLLGFSVAALAHSPRVGTALEKVAATAGFAERLAANPALTSRLANLARYSSVLAATIPTRHFGYSALTGGEESWLDSAFHAGGSLIAAEAGAVASGRATPLHNNGGIMSKPFQLAKYDAKGAAEFFAKEGYQTTGRLTELLNVSGYKREAAHFKSLASDTPITSQAAQQAIQNAELTYGRLSSVAQAILKEPAALERAARAAAKAEAKAAAKAGVTAESKAGTTVEVRGADSQKAPATEKSLGANNDALTMPADLSVNALQQKGESVISRLKHQVTDRFRLTAIEPTAGTAKQLARSRTGSAVYGSLAATATYNTLVTPLDVSYRINEETGKHYTWTEALREAHFPTSKEEQGLPEPHKWALRAFVGTPGDALFGAGLMSPVAITRDYWKGSIRNNLHGMLFSNRVLGPAGGFAGNRLWPLWGAFGTSDRSGYYQMGIYNARQPIQNDH